MNIGIHHIIGPWIPAFAGMTGGRCATLIFMKRRKKRISTPSSQNHLAFLQSLGYVLISFLIAFLLYQLGIFHEIVRSLDGYGYIGAFLGGMFFVSVFTAAPAGVILLTLSETYPIIPICILAGMGAVVGDFIILFFLSKGAQEVTPILSEDRGIRKVIKTLRHTKYRFLLTLVGAAIIASPLPDEIGLALMGASQLPIAATAAITFILNTLGIFFLLTVVK